jgi:hypothetical protein
MDLRETGWENVEWVQLVQDRDKWLAVVNAVMNFVFWRHGLSPAAVMRLKTESA